VSAATSAGVDRHRAEHPADPKPRRPASQSANLIADRWPAHSFQSYSLAALSASEGPPPISRTKR
jgi:hypothetical protein